MFSDEEIIKMYRDGKTYKEITQETKATSSRISKLVKGTESLRVMSGLKKRVITSEMRLAWSNNAKKNILNQENKVYTTPERGFKEILNEIGIGVKFPQIIKNRLGIQDDENATVVFQYPVQRYLCDFVDVKNRIVYEIHGDFWHANPILYEQDRLTKIQKFNLARDKNKKIFLENEGYKVIYIWESEIKFNKQIVIDKISAPKWPVKLSVLHTDFAGGSTLGAETNLDWSEKVKNLWFKKAKVKSKIKKTCACCNIEFDVSSSKRNEKRKYCSTLCSRIEARKIKNRPSKEELLQELKTSNLTKMGLRYGVTGNAIKKWIVK